jgi:succinate-semialdehyde dehydrogenase/glutarate-semialdehyde dehydrogenase
LSTEDEQTTKGIVDGLRTLKIGDPADASTRVGPMINEAAAIRAESWIAEAVDLGATLHLGGERLGSVLQPTLLSNVAVTAQLNCEEVFAPVVIVEAYENFSEVLVSVNRSPEIAFVGLHGNRKRQSSVRRACSPSQMVNCRM